MLCPTCHTEYPPSKKFCKTCGTPLVDGNANPIIEETLKCRSCGAVQPLGRKFCTRCRTSLIPSSGPGRSSDPDRETGQGGAVDTGRVGASSELAGRRLLVYAGGGLAVLVLTVAFWSVFVHSGGGIPPKAGTTERAPQPMPPSTPNSGPPSPTSAVNATVMSNPLPVERSRPAERPVKEQAPDSDIVPGSRPVSINTPAAVGVESSTAEIKREKEGLAQQPIELERPPAVVSPVPAAGVAAPPVPAPPPRAAQPVQLPPVYQGPSSGVIVWEGEVHGVELIAIDNGQASSGRVSGALPGVVCLVQPTDPRRVDIASAPAPSNQYRRLVIRVRGNGHMVARVTWTLP